MSLLIAAIIPVIAFLYVIYCKDTIKEPIGLLAKCFFGGCLSILLTLVLIYFFFPSIEFAHPALNAFYNAFFQAAMPEELAKFILLYWLVWNREEFDQHYDGIIYAVFVSMGFALVENIIYVFNYGYGTAITRGVFAVPCHGICGIAMGYFFSLARFSKEDSSRQYLIYSVLSAVILHGLYDFILMYMGADQFSDGTTLLLVALFLAFVAFQWKFANHTMQKHLQKDKDTIYQQALQERIMQEEEERLTELLKDKSGLEGNEEYHSRFTPEDKNTTL